jgi:hypothetical protein
MTLSGKLVAVALVLVEVATAVVVNFTTNGRASWLWPALGMLVAVTCALVWRLQVTGGSSIRFTRIRTTATTGGSVKGSPVDVQGQGNIDVVTKASWWGRVRDSGTTVHK